MIIIRHLNILDINKLKNLVSELGRDNFLSSKKVLLKPASIINNLLPAKFKFTEDTYVAMIDGEVKGMISLSPKRNNPNKWRIRNLLFDDNSYDIGKSLVDYVVARYGAQGVETFEVEIDSEENPITDLFSKSCGFRYCMDYQYFELKTEYFKGRNIDCENMIFRPFKNSDRNSVADLYNQNISPYYKFSLSKIPEEFCDGVCKGLDKKDSIKFIFEDKFSKQIRAFINILTEDNKCFFIETVILPSYENYFEDIITFSISQILKKTGNFTLYFKNCKFHENADNYERILYEKNNELIKTSMIFVRDFYRQIKANEPIKQSSVIYNEINGKPAYKI